MFDYDGELRRYRGLFRAACGVGAGELVLDVGCGAGQSTRDAARAAGDGSALGVDISARMIEFARQRAAEEGVGNVTFELADAARYPFASKHFDVVISRFGTMFFADPVEAFGNIGRALRPGGRLVMLVWQADERQEWSTMIRQTLAPGQPPSTGGPFTLADPDVVEGILTAAGFTTVDLTDLREPICYGPDAGTAYDAVTQLIMTTDRLAGLDDDQRGRALERLRAALAAHEGADGVWFDSRVWLVTARRP